ncbi:MAG TPA: hypothetical protein VFN35_23235 [Ktedonobacteraceae bacterium]|nr:hypothetical protein [Ktedonobacteraceae bacterium]
MVKKRFLIGSFMLLMLLLGLTLIPARIAHADECNGTCGLDPVQAGCTASQYIVMSQDFTAQNETWEIRLRSSHVQSSACINKVWASLVLKSGSNPTLSNSQDIQVYTTFQYDLLPSPHFGSGAYTNMLQFSNGFACAQYDGNGFNPPPAACSDHL